LHPVQLLNKFTTHTGEGLHFVPLSRVNIRFGINSTMKMSSLICINNRPVFIKGMRYLCSKGQRHCENLLKVKRIRTQRGLRNGLQLTASLLTEYMPPCKEAKWSLYMLNITIYRAGLA